MKAEYNALSKQIEENKVELGKILSEEKKVQSIIRALEKDVEGLKKEV